MQWSLSVLSLLALTTGALGSALPCCRSSPGAIIRPGGYCGEETKRISLNCSIGHMLLRDIVLKGDRVSTVDSPGFIFVKDPKEYCLGEMYRNESNRAAGKMPVAVVCFQGPTEDSYDIETSGVLTLISAVFLILTFAVYISMPVLRDLQGLCYSCMCISMALGFLSLGTLQLSPGFRGAICTFTGFLVYFWMMATFFWMNVICINLFRTVVDPNHNKRPERLLFMKYSGYAWGGVVVFLIVALITNFVEGDHYKPGIGDGNCWFAGRAETWIFFYGPVAVLLAANVGLFVFSSLHLWYQTKNYEMNKLNNLKYKFLLSLKLFLVMGISWVFEIASFAHGESHIIWKIMDIFNCLQGVIIFLLLVVLRRRVVVAMERMNLFVAVTRPLAARLSPHDDDDQRALHSTSAEDRDVVPGGTPFPPAPR